MLPKKVAAKYVTAAMIEPENYLQEFGDDQHPNPNIDLAAILLYGSITKIPEDLSLQR